MKKQLLSLVMCAALGAMSCGEAQETTTAPTPVAPAEVIQPLQPAAVEPGPVVVEAFCPFRVVDNLDATQIGTKLVVTWSPTFGPQGKTQYLRRYQIEVNRGSLPTVILEVEVTKLTGTDKVEVERTVVGSADTVKVRVWYPNECHGPEGNRLNTPWAGPVTVYHRH